MLRELNNENTERLFFLDVIRAIAAVLVMFYHFTSQISLINIFNYINIGQTGVCLFFICSGFIIPLSLRQYGSLKKFWIRRFFRLYPLYWINIAIWLVIVYLWNLGQFQSPSMQKQPIETVLSNVAMMQLVLGFDNIVPLYWTLNIEIIFYIFVSFLFVFRLLDHILFIFFTVLASAIVVDAVFPLIYNFHIERIASYLVTMFVGTAFYHHLAGRLKKVTVFFIIYCAFFMEFLTVNTLIYSGKELLLISSRLLAYVLFIIFFECRNCQPPRFILHLGLISYSLYLMHLVISTLIPPIYSPLISLIIWIFFTVVISTVTYRLIERPAMSVGKNFNLKNSISL